MSREIKFRAWNGSAMEYGGFLIHATGAILPDSLLSKVNHDSPIMQFAGLPDKNGVDIYEGDIDTEGYVFEFNTDMGGWYRMKNGEGFQWHAQALRKGRLPFEIAGNIYENKDLL